MKLVIVSGLSGSGKTVACILWKIPDFTASIIYRLECCPNW